MKATSRILLAFGLSVSLLCRGAAAAPAPASPAPSAAPSATPSAQPGSQYDPIIARLYQTSPGGWDAILNENRGSLGNDFLPRVMFHALKAVDDKRLADARTYALITDYVDYYAEGKKKYNGFAQLYLGQFLAAHGNVPTAIDVGQGLVKDHPDVASGYLLLGSVHMRENDKSAIEELKKAVQLAPDSPECHIGLALASLHFNQDYAGASHEIDEVLRIDPINREAQFLKTVIDHERRTYMTKNEQALAHYQKAESLFQQQHYKESIPEYEAAAKADPKFAKPYIYMGDSYFALGDTDKAIASYKKATEIAPTDGMAYRFMGDVYEKLFDQSREVRLLNLAIENYKKATEVDPDYTIARDDLKRAQEKLKSTEPRTNPPGHAP